MYGLDPNQPPRPDRTVLGHILCSEMMSRTCAHAFANWSIGSRTCQIGSQTQVTVCESTWKRSGYPMMTQRPPDQLKTHTLAMHLLEPSSRLFYSLGMLQTRHRPVRELTVLSSWTIRIGSLGLRSIRDCSSPSKTIDAGSKEPEILISGLTHMAAGLQHLTGVVHVILMINKRAGPPRTWSEAVRIRILSA